MIRHASSHGMAVFVCTIAAAFIVETLKPKLPELMDLVQTKSEGLIKTLAIPMTVDNLSILLVASILALIWGVFFKLRTKTR